MKGGIYSGSRIVYFDSDGIIYGGGTKSSTYQVMKKDISHSNHTSKVC